jgi:hypothetical protein
MSTVTISSIDSTSVEALQYDNESKKLTVEFKGGAIYDYYDVPEDVFEGFHEADSIGKYLNSQVKGSYNFEKISG